MPHVSGKKLPTKTKEKLEEHLFNLLMDTGGNSRQRIFKELYTKTERLMFAKRIGILLLIERGVSFYAISKTLGVSTSTVSRFESAVERGWFQETRKQLKRKHINSHLLKFLINVGAIPFGSRPKSLAKLIDEY